jgi:hypothetical protein
MDRKIGKWTFSEKAASKSLEVASQRGQEFLESTPRAVSAVFDVEKNLIIIHLANGCVFGFPPNHIKELINATEEELRNVTVTPQGTALHWDDLDAHYRLVGLLNGIFGTKTWMAELGRKGGSVSTTAKAEAARMNGSKGGRPRRSESESRIYVTLEKHYVSSRFPNGHSYLAENNITETSHLPIAELEKAKKHIEEPILNEKNQNTFKAKILPFPNQFLKQISVENDSKLEISKESENNYASQSIAA